MKIVFLDIDGVVNNTVWLAAKRTEARRGFEKDSDKWLRLTFDPANLEQLERVLSETGAKIVVSSAWRGRHNVQELRALFSKLGLPGEIVGRTRDSRTAGEPRGVQILDWLKDAVKLYGFTVDSFAVIDDENVGSFLSGFFVQTSMHTGLTESHADRAIDILNTSKQQKTEGGLLFIP